MNITSFSREELNQGLERAKSAHKNSSDSVRIIFSPRDINSGNIEEVYKIFSQITGADYDTVVVVESHPGTAEKKLPMPSFKTISTPLGEIQANDRLRNDFCDEDDDFYVNDDAFDSELSLHNQLMMLQCSLKDFSVLSIQITDENSFIVKELAFALEEILASKNTLIIFCCDLNAGHRDEFEKILQLYDRENLSGLMNYLNSGDSNIEGVGTFVAGLIVAKKWGLSLQFADPAITSNQNLIAGFAEMQHQPIFG